MKTSRIKVFDTPQQIVKLSFDEETDQYFPEMAIPSINADYIGPTYDVLSEEKQAVTSVHFKNETQSLYVGGNFVKFNNIYKYEYNHVIDSDNSTDRRNHSFFNVPKEEYLSRDDYIEIYGPDAPFSDCTDYNYENHKSSHDLTGAGFCCRVGSYCPDYLIDVPCPLGWGYNCNGPYTPTACEEGYYCLNPGRQIICPVGHVCSMGSNTPRKCEFWEICPDQGMMAPERISGLILASMVLGAMFAILVIGVRLHHRYTMKGRRHLDEKFEERFNAFSRQIKAPLKVFRRNSTESSKGIPKAAGGVDDEQENGGDGGDDGDDDFSVLDASLLDESLDDSMIYDSGSTIGGEFDFAPEKQASMLKSGLARPLAGGLNSGSAESGGSMEEGLGGIGVDEVEMRPRSSLGSSNNNVPQGREMKIDIEFKNLSVLLANKQCILNDVSGVLESGTMTAIMGPSGCGKSTFISALTNRIKDGGKVLGEIFINGEKKPLISIQHLVGFVPQDDIMHRDLTVRENLRFYAKLKGDPSLTKTQRRYFVNEVVDILGLKHVQHSLIGDELNRGISGGQRKRVNIGIELMGSPLLLYLDEPTSGLDATTSQQLIESLEKLSKLGLTIAMVIHQPRMETLKLIDQIILLQRGGLPVFIGKTVDCLPYMENFLDTRLPPKTSPADFFLDVIAEDRQDFEHGSLCDMWRKFESSDEGVGGGQGGTKKNYSDRIIPDRMRPNHFSQALTFWKRAVAQQLNNKFALFVDATLLIFSGGLVGTVARNDSFMGNQMTMMIIGMMGVVASLKIFGGEKAVYMREMQAGISSR